MHKDQPTPSNRLNFTKRVLDRLTLPSEGVAYFYDKDTKGLAISVGKTGRKSFLLYRRIQGRPERIKIGRYPDVSIEQARKTVAALNADIAQDLNPAESMRERRSEITLADFFKVYYERHCPSARSPTRKTSISSSATSTRMITESTLQSCGCQTSRALS